MRTWIYAALVPPLAATGPMFATVPDSESGIHWAHDNARSESRYLPETLGPGCAFLDYDQDGRLDVFLVNSGPSDFFDPELPPRHGLFRNLGDGSFEDVTRAAGIVSDSFGMGVAVGDYDEDGDPDLFLTAYGGTRLYENRGDGTFSDRTTAAGLDWRGWTTSAVWFDATNDGDLDLFVGSFVLYGPDEPRTCGENELGRAYYCIPRVFEPTSSRLYLNEGDGTFARSPDEAIATPGKALGVVAADVDGDGRSDLFVSNDTEPNFLLMNRAEGFEEVALWVGVAYDVGGVARSGMGVDAADVDDDGRIDLFVANVDNETSSLYLNDGSGVFFDAALEGTLGLDTLLLSGWGLRFFDADLDGDLDLLAAHGHPDDMVATRSSRVTYEEPLLLYLQDERGLTRASADAGPAFAGSYAARGLATGDYDDDGDLDVLVGVNGEAPLLLRNEATGRHWIGLRLVGTRSNRDAVGARVDFSANGRARHRLRRGGGSYLSDHDPRVVLGLGERSSVDGVEIHWPSGGVDRVDGLPLDAYSVVKEGIGVVGTSPARAR